MSIFDRGKRLRDEIQALSSKVHAQALIIDDITTAVNAGTEYVGNAYRTYREVIAEIASKYSGTAKWGVQPTKNIIDVRASFIIGQGVAVSPVDKGQGEKELEFVEEFFDYNDLDREMAQEFAKEAEIEGCFLGVLAWDEEGKQVALRFMSRVDTNYTIEHPENDYAYYTGATYHDGGAKKHLDEPEFVYARFGGRIHKINEPFPKIAACLNEIDSISHALRDWRKINELFAAPIPHIECKTAEEAKYMATALADAAKNWKVKKLFSHTGTLQYTSPDTSGAQMIESEVITLAKMISGATGVPVHFLGLPDLMSNRATADNLMELVTASTSKEREIWRGTYQQIISKAMALYNAKSAMTPLDPTLIEVTLPNTSEATWARIMDVWLPLYVAGAIGLDTLLSQIPGVDVDAEVKAQEERAQKAAEEFSRNQAADEEEEGEEEEEE